MKKMTTKRGLETSNDETEQKNQNLHEKLSKICPVEKLTFGQKVNGQ